MSDSSSYESIDSETERFNDNCKQFTQIDNYWSHCDICKVTMSNSRYIINEHVLGSQHQNAMDNLLEDHDMCTTNDTVYYCNLCEMYTNDFMEHIKLNIDHINWKWILGDVDKDKLKYYVHDADGSYNVKEAEHYRNLYKHILIRNCVKKINATKFHCEPYDLPLNRTAEISHIFGMPHRDGLTEYQRQRKL